MKAVAGRDGALGPLGVASHVAGKAVLGFADTPEAATSPGAPTQARGWPRQQGWRSTRPPRQPVRLPRPLRCVLVWMALAPLAPERFSAGSYMSLCGTYFFGRDPKTDEMFVHIEPAVGGWGAMADRDGTGALIATTDGDTYNYSIELFEAKVPLRVRQYALNTEGGAGAGRQRGGFGVVREFEIVADEAHTYCSYGRSIVPPWGLEGGGDGSTNYMEFDHDGETHRVSRIAYQALARGDRVRVVTGGGGGFGDPHDRPPEAVNADVRDGYITRDEARGAYGVVITEAGETDAEATANLRGGA